MISRVRVRIKPEEFTDAGKVRTLLEHAAHAPVNDFQLIRKSIDARQSQVWFELEYDIATGSDREIRREKNFVDFRLLPSDVPQVIIVGAGPAGLFAALEAIKSGWKPVVIERGKPVEERLYDVVALQKERKLNPESNFCFGEGGAGAFSDGKLFTRSKKRGNVQEVLSLLHQHGAKEEILYEAHPHIGSDKLPKVIKNIRETIRKAGGEVLFSTKFESLLMEGRRVVGVKTSDGKEYSGPVILATGHSARDVYETLYKQGIRLEQKGFAMGVRLEHPQKTIDTIIYHKEEGRGAYLPPAEYKMSTQVDGRGVYSFCMCPGGVVVPAVSAEGESVVNGMSASGRSGRWANSGMVVEIRPEDFPEYESRGALGMLDLQRDTERRFYVATDAFNVPAQRMKDFVEGKESKDLPATSYVPGVHPEKIASLFPKEIGSRLREGLKILGHKHKGFLTNEAMLLGLESRTSSPVRIPRDSTTYEHPDHPGLYPVGEGAGFAGGIVSAAMDGINAMKAMALNQEKNK